ncbi:U3 snoRNP protein [Arthrobotrys megalospora]
MTNRLLPSLLLRPSDYLASDCGIYSGSISCAQFYLNSLAEAEDINHFIHTAGFDVDQIWIQTQVLLEAIKGPKSLAHTSEANIDVEPPKKRARHRKELVATDFTDQKHDEGMRVGHGYPEETENLFSEPSSSEVGCVAPVSKDPKASFTPGRPRRKLQNHLDDGFFSIDAFNLDTENFERADELGQPFDGRDTTIDWHADPDDHGNASLSDSDPSDCADHAIMYTDFFLPPEHPGAAEITIDGDTNTSTRKVWLPSEEIGSLDGIGGAMNEIERDLFDELSGSVVSDREDSPTEFPGGIGRSSNRNTQARLNNRIRELEKQSLNQREWMLSGETNSKQRPFNSLLQEDLDFERIGKPVPVVTQESTTKLEDIIKSRILAGRFDEILRRNLEHYDKSRRSIVELDDSKSRVGLAEVYEREHLEGTTPNQPKGVDAKVAALRSEIRGLFSVVSNQLDMLSSWNFTPKAPQSALSIVQDVRTLDMEEVQVNSNHLSGSRSTALAPQDVYNPSSKTHQSDGVIKVSGIPVSLSEVERSRRAREKGRKGKGASDPSKAGTSTDESTRILNTLRRADVAVIDRDGKQVSLAGSPRPGTLLSSGSRIKL